MVGDAASLIKSLSDFGGLGIVIAFLMWWTTRCDKQRREDLAEAAKARSAQDELRLAYDRERLAADKELAGAFAALTAAIQSRVR